MVAVRDYVLNFVPTKRRLRYTRTGRSYSHPENVAERAKIRSAYKGELYDGAVAVYIDIRRPLPKNTPKRVESEPDTKTPDVDNIAKAIMDALQPLWGRNPKTGKREQIEPPLAFYDDAQVVALHVTKHPRTRKAGESVRFRVEPVEVRNA